MGASLWFATMKNIHRSQFLAKITEKESNTIQKKRTPTRLETLTFPIRFKQTQWTNQINTINKTNNNTCFMAKNKKCPRFLLWYFGAFTWKLATSWCWRWHGGSIGPCGTGKLWRATRRQFEAFVWEVWCPKRSSWRISLQWKGLNEPVWRRGV